MAGLTPTIGLPIQAPSRQCFCFCSTHYPCVICQWFMPVWCLSFVYFLFCSSSISSCLSRCCCWRWWAVSYQAYIQYIYTQTALRTSGYLVPFLLTAIYWIRPTWLPCGKLADGFTFHSWVGTYLHLCLFLEALIRVLSSAIAGNFSTGSFEFRDCKTLLDGLISLTVPFLDVGCGPNCGKRKGINWVVTRVKCNLVFFRVKEFVYCGRLWGNVFVLGLICKRVSEDVVLQKLELEEELDDDRDEEDDEKSRWMWWN